MPKHARLVPKYAPRIGLWVLNIPLGLSETGKRTRRFFRDRKEAFRIAQQMREANEKYGTHLLRLTPAHLAEASECYRLLEVAGRPYSLLSIVRESLQRHEEENVSVSLQALFEEYLATREHLSEAHRNTLRAVASRFEKIEEKVCNISPDTLAPILAQLSNSTKNRYLRTLRSVFSFGIRRGYLKTNPAEKLDFEHHEKSQTETFSNAVIEGMLNEAARTHIDLVPYFALGAFCGLRAGSPELRELLWSDIHFDEKTIVVRPEIAKTGQKRFVSISENCLAWLKFYLEQTGHSATAGRVLTLTDFELYEKRSKVFHAVAGPEAVYIKAGLRHSYASNHLAFHNDINSLVLALGHQGNVNMLWKHYHLATKKADAVAFWNIFPPAN
jgi:integrase